MVLLQAHPSSCSQQGPTWPCLLSRPMATATQQRQATASRHSPASVMACEHPSAHPPPAPPTRLDPTPPFHLSFLSLCSSPASHGLLLTTGATSKQQPTLVLSTIFLFCCPVTREKHLTASKDFYLYCLKRNRTTHHVSLFYTFHIYDYFRELFFSVYVYVMFFYCFGRSGLAKAQQWAFEVGGGALDFALVKKLM